MKVCGNQRDLSRGSPGRLTLLLLLLLAACNQPDFRDVNGKGYDYESFRGSYLVINYWATWCAPCIKEVPELARLDAAHDDIFVFGVNFDSPEGDEAAAQIEKMNITFPVYERDPWQALGIEKPQVMPTTVILGPEGELVTILVGPQTESSLLAAMGRARESS